MKEKTTRRKHSVNAKVQILDLTRAGSSIYLEIFADGEKLGDIALDQGSINWISRRKRTWGKPLTWSKFADLMHKATYGDD